MCLNSAPVQTSAKLH
ncbi:conserved hypothetical protein, partial [Trichinella spiralis]